MMPMSTGDKLQSMELKEVSLKELTNESGNATNRSPKITGLSEVIRDTNDHLRVEIPNSTELSETKRKQTDDPLSPSSYQARGKISNGNLVYVRRKLETGKIKTATCNNLDYIGSPDPKKTCNSTSKEHYMHQSQHQDKKEASHLGDVADAVEPLAPFPGNLSAACSVRKPFTLLPVPETHHSVSVDACAFDLNKVNDHDWKDRFIQFQLFMKNLDQSGQEDYIQMLQSLSAAGRSRHAVELEKRAIYLLLEEGKELHRMKILNVLGKPIPEDHLSLPTQSSKFR